jgi:hypothetical protein
MVTEVKAVLELEKHSEELIDQVRDEHPARFALSKDGEIVAGLVSPRDLNRLEQLDDERARDWARLREIRDQYFSGVSPDELLEEALKAQKEGRDEADEAARNTAAAH